MFFVRFTNTPEKDMEVGHSYHQLDGNVSAAKEAYQNGETIKFFRTTKTFAIEFEGLCGFALESEDKEEAKAEIQEKFGNQAETYNIHDFKYTIFEGEYADTDIPDGDVFIPGKII